VPGDRAYLWHAALRVAGVHPPRAGAAVVDRVTGIVVADDAGAWEEAIGRLAADPALRASLGAAAHADLLAHRLARHGADRLLGALFHLAAPGKAPAATAEGLALIEPSA
jgi:hypothetical protein